MSCRLVKANSLCLVVAEFTIVSTLDGVVLPARFVSNNLIFLFDEASSVVDVNLHALFHNLANRDQVLRYCWNMQDVLNVGLIALSTEGNISNMLDGVRVVFASFDDPQLFWLL